MADGVVPTRLKEAAALAIAVVKRCDGCIAYHAKAAARAGATPQEVAELLAVALLMDGGTASVYGPRAWEGFHEVRDAAAPAAASAGPRRGPDPAGGVRSPGTAPGGGAR